jgi:heavy metal translocating P-type ATPase
LNKIITTEKYNVSGMTCSACSNSIETYLNNLNGIQRVAVNLVNETLLISYDKEKICIDEVAQEVKNLGYGISNFNVRKSENNKSIYKLIASFVITLPIFVFDMLYAIHFEFKNELWAILTFVNVFILGWNFHKKAVLKLKMFTTNMDTLISLGSVLTFVYSLYLILTAVGHTHTYFEAASFIISFIFLGKFIEEKSKRKSNDEIKKLIGLKSDSARVIINDKETIISRLQIRKNDIINVLPGEKIPTDGIILSGYTTIDESSLTGELIPIEKKESDLVISGSLNLSNFIRIKSSCDVEYSTLETMIQKLENAQTTKISIQKVTDYISSIFVPIVIVFSVATFCIWYYLVPNTSFSIAFEFSISVLVISCPCAIGLATPIALVLGIGNAAKQGILIKDGEALEIAQKIRQVFIDKTGTLTEGKPIVTSFNWVNEENKEEFMNILFSMESKSEHSLAKAVVDYLILVNPKKVFIKNVETIIGSGIKAIFKNDTYYAVSKSYIEKLGVKDNFESNENGTEIYFIKNNEIIAIINLKDKIRLNAKEVIQELNKLEIETTLISGDNNKVVEDVAVQLNINRYFSNLNPFEKETIIIDAKKHNSVVAMIGDGINDSLALSAADLSITPHNASDLSIHTSQVTLLNTNLKQVLKLITISKQTFSIIKQNLFWAFIYNVAMIPIAAGVFYSFNLKLSPELASIAMSLSSLTVVINSLRLKY